MADPHIVALLEDNMREEHAAIVQHLYHAFRLKGDQRAELEELAREHMRHMQWLAEALAARGRPPVMERAVVQWETASAADALRLDAALAARAVTRYEEQARTVSDPTLRLLFQRIAADERVHVRELGEMAAQAETAGIVLYPRTEEVDPAGLSPEELAQDIALLNEDLRLEYTVILQYIYQAFVVKDCAFSRTLLEDQGQESMKHMGWLAETIIDLGSLPVLEPGPIDLTTDEQAILALNLRLEHEAHDQYARHLAQLRHPLARATLGRIFEQESFHIQQFALLQQASAGAAAARSHPPLPGAATDAGLARRDGWPRLTVGSLLGQRQP